MRWLFFVAIAACSSPSSVTPPPDHDKDAPIPGPPADAAAPAIAPRASVVVPTFALGGRTYFDVATWYDLAVAESGELLLWGSGAVSQVPVPNVSSTALAKLQAATATPAPWRSVVGATLPAYHADGRACDSTIAGLYLLGYGFFERLEPGITRLVAEIGHATDCAPVLVTNRSAPVFFVPAPPPSAAERRALAGAFAAIARPLRVDDPPTIQIYERAGTRLAMVSVETVRPDAHTCGQEYRAQRATFELVASGKPRVVSQTSAYFGVAPLVAVFDSDGDGLAEAAFGAAHFDHGGTERLVLASYLDFRDAADPEDEELAANDLGFDYPVGCD